jgi:hypothetical protein
VFSALLLYSLLIIVSCRVFPGAVLRVMQYFDRRNNLSDSQLLLLSLGITPFLISLIIYYLLVLLPHKPAYFYFSIISACFLIPGYLCRNHKRAGIKEIIKGFFKDLYKARPEQAGIMKIQASEKTIYLRPDKLFVLCSLSLFVILGIRQTGSFISGHDMLEYSVQGRYFGEQKNIVYEQYHFNPENDFYYVGLHGYSFPLIRTWEYFFGEMLLKTDTDYLFRNISLYYYLLLFLFGFTLLSAKPFYIKLLWSVIMYLPLGFSNFMIGPHIDAYRIFMISVSLLLLYKAIECNHNFMFMLLFVFTGAQAFIHSLGVFIATIIMLSFFLFVNKKMKDKLLLTAVFGFILLLMGNIHYLLDTFIGTGWIFQSIKYY